MWSDCPGCYGWPCRRPGKCQRRACTCASGAAPGGARVKAERPCEASGRTLAGDDQLPPMEEVNGAVPYGETHPGILASLGEGANDDPQWSNALRVGYDAHPFLELACLVPRVLPLDGQVGPRQQGNELGGRQHADVRRIA